MMLAGSFVGFTIAVVARIRGARLPLEKTLPPLVACTAALGLTDESALGTLGLSLGVTWLIFPTVVADTRRAGVGVLPMSPGMVTKFLLSNLATRLQLQRVRR